MVFGFCSHMADARLADLLAEQATARRRAEQIAQSLSAIQAGRPETARLSSSASALRTMELKLLERQMDLNMEIDKVRAEIEAAAPPVSAFAPLSAPESGSAPSTQQRKKQLTMANWVLVKDSEDSLVMMIPKLQCPLAHSLTSLVCPDCGSTIR